VAILVVFVAPLWLAIGTILRQSAPIIEWTEHLAKGAPPPAWLEQVPLVGAKLTSAWQEVGDDDMVHLLREAKPYAGRMARWFLEALGSLGSVFIQFLLTVVMTAIIYAKGEDAAATARRFGARLAGGRGEQAVVLAGQAVRSVALGVVITAFIQAAIGTLGLLVAGIPFVPILSALMFMMCIAQLGPGFVLVPAIAWLFIAGDTTWAIVLTIISIPAMTVDNFVRPVLIRRGIQLPLLLILAGVIGGLVAFGLIGVFVGPMVLAVGYTLMRAWLAEAEGTGVPAPKRVPA